MIRIFRGALWAALALCALAPARAGAQRTVPPLYPTAPIRPVAPTGPDTTGLEVRLSPGRVQGVARQPVARGERLGDAEAARLLARARPLAPDSAARDSFAFPAQTLPAPRSGATVLTGLGARDSAGPARPAPGTAALTVTRRAPVGEVPLGAEVTVTFSQPMVPLGSVGSLEGRAVPARITPQPAGEWRWLDVRTLRFEPRGRLPMATEFTVEVPAGTTSATGARLSQGVRWSFATPAPRATGAWPHEGAPVRVQPVIVVAFDQRVNRADVLPRVQVAAGGATIPVRIATAAEVAADAEASARTRGLEAGRWIAFVPTRPLPNDAGVEVALLAGLPSAEGPRRTEEVQRWSFRTFGRLRLVRSQCGYGPDGCRPGMPLSLQFSTPIPDTVDAARLVRVTPAIEGMRVAVGYNQITIVGRTRPFTRYTVRVDGALRDIFGQRLGEPAEASFQVGAPVALIGASGQTVVVLDPQGPPAVSVFARGHRRVRVRVHRVEPDDWPAFNRGMGRGGRRTLPGREVLNEVRELGAVGDDMREVVVSVERALEGGVGHAAVAVEAVEGATEGERMQATFRWVQSTRIGLVAFSDARELTAWATSLVDGRPLPGVELRLSGAAAASTDVRGLATLALPAAGNDAYLVARLGNDAALLASGMGSAGWAQWTRREQRTETAAFVFTDRGLYRPGETVRFKGWLRRLSPGSGPTPLPRATPLEYRVTDGRGNEIARGTLALTELGGFDASFALPAGANLGAASVEVRAGPEAVAHFSVAVQEFRRPEYEVGVTADPGPHFVGGGAEAVARASYFSGGGLPGAPVAWSVSTAPAWFAPPGWDRWSFGPTRPWWWWMEDGDRDGAELEQLSGVTDATGAHALRLDFGRARPPRAHTATASATVTDVNRQTWTSAATFLVHPASVYLGLRTERAWLEEGDTLELELIAVDLDGRAVAGRPIEVSLVRREWRMEGGRWRDVEAGRERCARVSAAEPVRCDIPVRGGDYVVEATTTDAQGRATLTTTRLWVTGPGVRFPDRGGNDTRRVEMVPDRERYEVGDTARILLRLPFQPVRGVVTFRRGGVVRTESFEAAGATHTLRVPITEADVPGVHLGVEVTGATEGGTDERPTARGVDGAQGEVMLSVSRATRTLTVRPIPSDSVMLPDAEGAVTVEVRGPDGRPVAGAEVALVGVDESILALTGYRIGDPVAAFFPEPQPEVAEVRLRPLVRVQPRELAPAPGTLVGRVVRMNSGEPVGGARVVVVGTALEARTDPQGRFRIVGVPRGPVVVVAELEGFESSRQQVQVGADAPAPLRLYLLGAEEMAEERMMVSSTAARQAADFAGADRAGGVPMPTAPPPPPPPPPAEAPAAPEGARFRLDASGAGGQAPIAIRSNFNPLAVWGATVRTDAQGRVRVPFRVPSNLTRYRLTAVAVEAARFGVGESAIAARQPLMVRPSAPRFLNFGDRFELPVVLQNTTGTPMTVQVAARATGVRFFSPGERVTVPAGDRVEVRLAAEAVQAGTARVQVVAAGGGAQDAAEFTLPVYTPATAEAFATYGTLESGAATLPLEVPAGAIPSFGGLEVSTSSTALSELTDAFLYLVSYPFEGTEQVASRMLAVAALRDVLGAMNASGLPPADSVRATVAEDVRRLAARQNPDGGFAWWERGRPTAPYASVHAAHALQRVREAGFDVPAEVWNRALGYLRRIPGNLPNHGPEARRALHAYALYTRQRMGENVDAEAARLVAEAGDALPLEAAGWLLAATRAPEVRDPLLRLVNNRATETAQTATFAARYTEGEELLLHSSRRTDAVVLEGLLAADPRSELASKTVRGLLGNRVRGRWGNPQENAWVLLAVQRYFRAFEAQAPDFVARVWLGDRLAATTPFRGRSGDRALTRIPMRVLQSERPSSVTVGMEGTGRLYFRAGLRYAPRDLDLPPLERGFVVDRTYEAVDSAADVTRGADGIWRVRAGARVRVTVTMTAPSRRLHVALVDPLPAGWEPVNAALRGAEPVPTGPGPRGRPSLLPAPERSWAPTWWEHQNLRDDRAEAFSTFVPAGTYTYSYVARATTPGLFIVPPPRAEEMYSPETFGRGATERVIVQ